MPDEVTQSKLGAPSSAGLSRLARHLGVDAPRVIGRLRGGAACDVFGLEYQREGVAVAAVLKVFPAHMASTAAFEWAAMNTAALLPIPTPDPLAFDQSGTWFGTPATLMSRLPGSPMWEPVDVAEWSRQFASTLAAVHETAPQVPESMTRPAIWDRWTPVGLPEVEAKGVRSALARLAEPRWERGICHGDFHPGNVLFDGSAVTGVVDWISARGLPS